MINSSDFNNISSRTLSFRLSENYRDNRSFPNHFNEHVNLVFMYESMLSNGANQAKSNQFVFSKRRYAEAETAILSELDTINSEDDELLFDDLEDQLYAKVESDLGQYFDRNQETLALIDHTVHSVLKKIRFQFFDAHQDFLNPWEGEAAILYDSNYLFKPIFDETEFDEIKKLKRGARKSEVHDNTEIYVAVKAKTKHFSYGSFKDFIRLRLIFLDFLSDKMGSSRTPVSFAELANEFMKMDSSITENEIKSKIIYPLKSMSKIGSCKEGYFLLETAEDIEKSYRSHFQRWKGYYRTLEAHRMAAKRLDSDYLNIFDAHL